MRFLLFAVGLLLGCGLRAQAEDSEELSSQDTEMSGYWFTAALASSNPALIMPGGPFRIYICKMDTQDGNLHGELLKPEGDHCERQSLTAFQSGDDGKFYLEFNGKNEVSANIIKPEKFMIFFLRNENNNETSLLAHLMTRTTVADEEAIQAFHDVCKSEGLLDSQILRLDHTDRCDEFRD